MTPSMASETHNLLENMVFQEHQNSNNMPLRRKSFQAKDRYVRKQSSGRKFMNKQQLQALIFNQDIIAEEDSQNLIIDAEYSQDDQDQYDQDEEGDGDQYSQDDFYGDEEDEFNNYPQTKSEVEEMRKFRQNQLGQDEEDEEEEGRMQQEDYQQFLQNKYDLVTQKMEEKEMKRKDPNRDYVINEGNNFLGQLMFHNQNLDTRKATNINANLNSANDDQTGKANRELISIGDYEVQPKNFDEQTRRAVLKEHWLIHDKNGTFIRENNVKWEKYMEQIGIHQARRIYLTMPGSMQPSIVTTILNYKPKKKKMRANRDDSSSTSSSDDSSSDSSDSSSRDEGFDSLGSDSNSDNDPFNLIDKHNLTKENTDQQQIGKDVSLQRKLSRSSSMSSSSGDSSSSSSSGSSNSSGREGYARNFRIKEHFNFQPLFLDDTKLGQGKNKHVVSLPSYKMAMLPFVNPQRKKDELNRMFQKTHPKISKNLSLSKIRKLKLNMIEMFLHPEDSNIDQRKIKKLNDIYLTEIYSIAQGWVLFEKLIYKGLVKKSNRKIMAAICLLIALKNNQIYGGYKSNEKTFAKFKQNLIEFIEKRPRQSYIYYELKILSKLNFYISVPLKIILQQIESILTTIDTSLSDYLGEEAYNEYLAQRQEHRRIQNIGGKRRRHHHRRRLRLKQQRLLKQRAQLGNLAATQSAGIPGINQLGAVGSHNINQSIKKQSIDENDELYFGMKKAQNQMQAFEVIEMKLGATQSAPVQLNNVRFNQ
eukprot:403374268